MRYRHVAGARHHQAWRLFVREAAAREVSARGERRRQGGVALMPMCVIGGSMARHLLQGSWGRDEDMEKNRGETQTIFEVMCVARASE